MAPIRVEQRVLHGQRVAVKVYPSPSYTPSETSRPAWSRGTVFTVDTTAYEEPMTEATKRSLSKPSPAPYSVSMERNRA